MGRVSKTFNFIHFILFNIQIHLNLSYSSEITDLSANEYFINSYGKTHMRATSYVFGLLVGFLAYLIHEKK